MPATTAQQTAIRLTMAAGGNIALHTLRALGVRDTTVRALARRRIVTIDGPNVRYVGEPGAPVYELPDGYAWRCPCGSRGSGGSEGEATDWRNQHLRDHH